MKVLAISGSFRKNSYNKALLNQIIELSDKNLWQISLFDISQLPIFNQDLESDLPIQIKDLITRFAQAEALIIATPEYNNMMPGALKNMFEWLSRSYAKHLIINKPLAICGASDGGFGTARAQVQLLTLGAVLQMRVNGSLRLAVSHAQNVFSQSGELVDQSLKTKITDFLANFYKFCQQK